MRQIPNLLGVLLLEFFTLGGSVPLALPPLLRKVQDGYKDSEITRKSKQDEVVQLAKTLWSPQRRIEKCPHYTIQAAATFILMSLDDNKEDNLSTLPPYLMETGNCIKALNYPILSNLTVPEWLGGLLSLHFMTDGQFLFLKKAMDLGYLTSFGSDVDEMVELKYLIYLTQKAEDWREYYDRRKRDDKPDTGMMQRFTNLSNILDIPLLSFLLKSGILYQDGDSLNSYYKAMDSLIEGNKLVHEGKGGDLLVNQGEIETSTCSLGRHLILAGEHDPLRPLSRARYTPRSMKYLDLGEKLIKSCYNQRSQISKSCKEMEELLSSLFSLYRSTGNPLYMEWGWKTFLRLRENCENAANGNGTSYLYSGIRYVYLMFSQDDINNSLLPDDEWVWNSAGFPLKIVQFKNKSD